MLHLIHPALVHFSVAFVVAGGSAEVWGLLAEREALRRWGATLVLVGLASLVPTLASGYLAANTLDVPEASESLLAAHERNGWIVFGLLAASQFWKAWCGGRIPDRHRLLYAAGMLATVLLTAYSAWLGGRMVYTHAIGVL
jgi:uncharacterized membrane protein